MDGSLWTACTMQVQAFHEEATGFNFANLSSVDEAFAIHMENVILGGISIRHCAVMQLLRSTMLRWISTFMNPKFWQGTNSSTCFGQVLQLNSKCDVVLIFGPLRHLGWTNVDVNHVHAGMCRDYCCFCLNFHQKHWIPIDKYLFSREIN